MVLGLGDHLDRSHSQSNKCHPNSRRSQLVQKTTMVVSWAAALAAVIVVLDKNEHLQIFELRQAVIK